MNLSKEALVDFKQLPPTATEIRTQIQLGNVCIALSLARFDKLINFSFFFLFLFVVNVLFILFIYLFQSVLTSQERLLDLPNEAFPLFEGQKRTLHDSLSKIIKTKKVPLNGSLPCPMSPRPHVHMLSQQQVELMSPRGHAQALSPRGLMSPRGREFLPLVEEPPLSASKKKSMTSALADSARHVMQNPTHHFRHNYNPASGGNTNASSSTAMDGVTSSDTGVVSISSSSDSTLTNTDDDNSTTTTILISESTMNHNASTGS
jgi:hypothetical protein